MNMVYNLLIFCEIFNVKFQGFWYTVIKVKFVNKDEQNAMLILNTSRHHMIKCSCELL